MKARTSKVKPMRLQMEPMIHELKSRLSKLNSIVSSLNSQILGSNHITTPTKICWHHTLVLSTVHRSWILSYYPWFENQIHSNTIDFTKYLIPLKDHWVHCVWLNRFDSIWCGLIRSESVRCYSMKVNSTRLGSISFDLIRTNPIWLVSIRLK